MKARENPFRVERQEALRFRLPGFTWTDFMTRLQQAAYRGAIVGPHGSGKTTFVAELSKRLINSGFQIYSLRLNSEHRQRSWPIVETWLSHSVAEQLLILDGAEQLGFLAWRKFVRRTAIHRGLLITQHRPRRLPTLLMTSTTFERFFELVQELVQQGEIPEKRLLQELFRRHRGNVRDCLRDLYDRGGR